MLVIVLDMVLKWYIDIQYNHNLNVRICALKRFLRLNSVDRLVNFLSLLELKYETACIEG